MIFTSWLRKRKPLLKQKALVLMYHRIADVAYDPWQLAVSPVYFEQQLQVLKRKFTILPITKLAKQLETDTILSDSVYITFDDGYSDNYYTARPLLEKYDCPATFFIPSEFINKKQLFWWDELQVILLETEKLPVHFSLKINGEKLDCTLENDGVLTEEEKGKQKSWIWYDPPPTQRCRLYLSLWERLQPLAFNDLNHSLNEIKSWAQFTGIVNKEAFPMTHEQLEKVSDHSLFTIGTHTVTHPALAFHSLQVQRKEIQDCHLYLRQHGANAVNMIAYPYGNYNDDTIAVAKEQGLGAGFTTTEQLITGQSDPYHLGRFQVKNWSGEAFERHLHNWVNSLR